MPARQLGILYCDFLPAGAWRLCRDRELGSKCRDLVHVPECRDNMHSNNCQRNARHNDDDAAGNPEARRHGNRCERQHHSGQFCAYREHQGSGFTVLHLWHNEQRYLSAVHGNQISMAFAMDDGSSLTVAGALTDASEAKIGTTLVVLRGGQCGGNSTPVLFRLPKLDLQS